MSRWVDLDACPCNGCKEESVRCFYSEQPCEEHDKWYEGVDVVPMEFHERCLNIEINKRIEMEKNLVKHGYWILDTDTHVGGYICSECERWIPRIKDANFCSRCGAKMEEVTE